MKKKWGRARAADRNKTISSIYYITYYTNAMNQKYCIDYQFLNLFTISNASDFLFALYFHPVHHSDDKLFVVDLVVLVDINVGQLQRNITFLAGTKLFKTTKASVTSLVIFSLNIFRASASFFFDNFPVPAAS